MRLSKQSIALLCSAALTFPVGAEARNLILNPGFETNGGNIQTNNAPPWNVAGGALIDNESFYSHNSTSSGWLAYENCNCLNGVTANGSISQHLAISKNGLYAFSFFTSVAASPATYQFIASIGGQVVVNRSVSGSTYQHITTNVALSSGMKNLVLQGTLTNLAGPDAFTVDDFSLLFLHALAVDLRSAALTSNQRSIAGAIFISSHGNTGSLSKALGTVSNSAAPAVLDSLSGEGIAASQNIAYRSAQLFNDAIFDQTTFYGSGGTGNSVTLTAPQPGFLAYAPQVDAPRSPIHELADLPSRVAAPMMPAFAPTRTWRAWGSGFGGVDNIHGNGTIGSASQNNDIYGGALGVDYQLTPNYLVGVAVGGSDGEFSVPGRSTFGSTTGGHIAFYDIATFGSFYGASSNSFSYFSNRTTRNVAGFGGLGSETDRGNFDSHEFRTRLEFGRHFSGYGGTITPFVALELAELRSNGFTESSVSGPGLFALNVNGQSSASVPSFVGVRYQGAMTLGSSIVLSPSMEVAYVHEFAPQRTQIGTLTDLPGSTFLVDGARPSYNAAKVKVGGEIALTPRSFLFANFDGEFSGIDQFYGGKGGFKYLW